MATERSVARINDWLSVGNCKACQDPGYGMVIHIFRHDTGEKQERHCIHPGTRHNLRMDYKDGRLIDPSNMRNLTDVLRMLRAQKRPTLVHCHAGMCRSPLVAIYLLVFVDGMHPYDAHNKVVRQIYDQRKGEVCNVVYEPFKQLVRKWEAERGLWFPEPREVSPKPPADGVTVTPLTETAKTA